MRPMILLLLLLLLLMIMVGCGDEDCDGVGTYTLYLNFGAGECDEQLPVPWERIYTISRKSDGGFLLAGGPNEVITSEFDLKRCRVSLSSTQMAPRELVSETVNLVLNWSLEGVPVGDGRIVLRNSLCQQDLVVTGRVIRF